MGIPVYYGGEEFTVKNSVTVDGEVRNQYSLDEYEGNLRVVTTTTEREHSEKGVDWTLIGSSDTLKFTINASLYVNGSFSETIALDAATPVITDGFRIGSDRRLSDGQYFKGTIYGVSLFEDVRSAEEIANDAIIVTSDTDGILYSAYYTEP